MDDAWKPRIVNAPLPLVEVAKEAAPQVIVMPADPSPRPKAWEFVPIRDDQKLIVKIIATPVY
jgi:hypothetical protein